MQDGPLKSIDPQATGSGALFCCHHFIWKMTYGSLVVQDLRQRFSCLSRELGAVGPFRASESSNEDSAFDTSEHCESCFCGAHYMSRSCLEKGERVSQKRVDPVKYHYDESGT
jgi:hypothetical protein